MQKTIQILGSTGSIGSNAMNVILQHTDKFQIKTITANTNVKKLAEQAIEFLTENVIISDIDKYDELRNLLKNTKIKVHAGQGALLDLAGEDYDITIVGITGIAALPIIEKAIIGSKVIGLANKESIVCAGDIILNMARQYNTKIIPLDSEHNAIFQSLDEEGKLENIDQITLTASGGPFLNTPIEKMKYIASEEAVKHPKWKMGKKISVDCSNMMNKGLEVIEACKLFSLPPEKISVVVHPESIIHGMVSYADGSNIAQLSVPDMRTPISLALNYPKRIKFNYKPLNLADIGKLNFFSPDYKRFPLLKIAIDALKEGNNALIALNIANEVAVDAFLNNRIGYMDIEKIIKLTLENLLNAKINNIEDVLDYNNKVFDYVKNLIS